MLKKKRLDTCDFKAFHDHERENEEKLATCMLAKRMMTLTVNLAINSLPYFSSYDLVVSVGSVPML